jgi:maltose-binding protein MalE
MKKSVLGVFAVALLAFSMASCGENLLTPEQEQAEIKKRVDEKSASIISEASAKCDAEFEARVTAKVDELLQQAEVRQQAAAEAAATSK